MDSLLQEYVTKFLSLYFLHRPVGYYKGAETAVYGWLGAKSPTVKLTEIINEAITEAKKANSFEAWYELVFKLREQAKKAQNVKWLKDDSLATNILHGAASLLLFQLREHPIYADLLNEKINAKITSIAELLVKREKDRKKNGGDKYKAYTADINNLKKDLAELAVIEYVGEAWELNLFSYLPKRLDEAEERLYMRKYTEHTPRQELLCTIPVNYCGPLQYQPGYADWMYHYELQGHKQPIGYKGFLDNIKIAHDEAQMLAMDKEKRNQLLVLALAARPSTTPDLQNAIAPSSSATPLAITSAAAAAAAPLSAAKSASRPRSAELMAAAAAPVSTGELAAAEPSLAASTLNSAAASAPKSEPSALPAPASANSKSALAAHSLLAAPPVAPTHSSTTATVEPPSTTASSKGQRKKG